MPILNYTTSIKAEKTLGEIQAMLGRAGAQAVMCEYDDGVVCALSFRIEHNSHPISFRMPANINNIYVILQRDSNVPRKLRTMDQAARVAWRVIKVWIEAQLALIEAEQAEMIQVFLPYAQDATGETLYSALASSQFKQLTHKV